MPFEATAARLRPGGEGLRTGMPLCSAHPLARLAARRCRQGHIVPGARLVGGVACGACWEHVIRADERFVALFDLDDAEPVPADDVDEIAVERACRGERVPLTRFERRVAVVALADTGLTAYQIADRLHMAGSTVHTVLTRARAVSSASEVA